MSLSNQPSPHRFQLLLFAAGQLRAEDFRRFAEDELHCGPLRVTRWVIGESSLIRVRRGTDEWYELVACSDAPGGLLSLGVAEPGVFVAGAMETGGLSYSARLWLDDQSSRQERPQLGLHYDFATDPPAETRIVTLANEDTLRVTTWHDYPERGVCLRSESNWCWVVGTASAVDEEKETA